jgi:hypothetical protein
MLPCLLYPKDGCPGLNAAPPPTKVLFWAFPFLCLGVLSLLQATSSSELPNPSLARAPPPAPPSPTPSHVPAALACLSALRCRMGLPDNADSKPSLLSCLAPSLPLPLAASAWFTLQRNLPKAALSCSCCSPPAPPLLLSSPALLPMPLGGS